MPIPATGAATLAAGAPVTIGIRPEDIYAPEGLTSGLTSGLVTAEFGATVSAVELLGAETLLLVQPEGLDQEIVARVGRDSRARPGDRLTLHIDTIAVRLFDPSSGNALATAGDQP